MPHQRPEQVEHDSSSRLPILPPKTKVKSNHLNFREPGYVSAVERFQSLGTKIKLLQTEEEKLKKEQEELKIKCRNDLDEMRRQRPRLSSLPFGPSIEAWSLFDKIGDALAKAISLDDPEGQQEEESVELEKVRRRLKRRQETIEMEYRIRSFCNRTLDRLREELDKIKKKLSEEDLEDQSGKDHGLNWEDNEDQKEKGNDDRIENGGENDNVDGNEDTEDGIENDNKKGEKTEKPQRAEETRKEILRREDKRRRQSLQSQIREKEQEKEAFWKRCEKAKADEQELRMRISEYLAAKNRDRGKQETYEHWLAKEDEKIAESSGQNMRREQLQELQKGLPYFRKTIFGTQRTRRIRDLGSDDLELEEEFEEESNEQNDLKQLEKTLQGARALENFLTSLRWLRDRADQKRDLRIALDGSDIVRRNGSSKSGSGPWKLRTPTSQSKRRTILPAIAPTTPKSTNASVLARSGFYF